ncbi:unnamed protein product [Coffea canephora]|uniref:Uncharacterized protein n=1 Tax=Coffea canephora TaxID=49390 RepID=A0A068V4Z1_COFCA|nr:unnamed protein product [Coffea canephora]
MNSRNTKRVCFKLEQSNVGLESYLDIITKKTEQFQKCIADEDGVLNAIYRERERERDACTCGGGCGEATS